MGKSTAFMRPESSAKEKFDRNNLQSEACTRQLFHNNSTNRLETSAIEHVDVDEESNM